MRCYVTTGIERRHSEGAAGLASSQFKYFSCRPISKPRSRVSRYYNFGKYSRLSSSSLLFNSKSKFKLSLHSLFLFFSPQFFPLHPPQPDYISSRFDRVSGWEYHRRGSNDALMTEERRTASDRLWVRECRGFGPTFATCGGEDGEKGSRRNKRDTTGIYDRPPHYYSMNFNAKRTVSRRDTRGGFFAKAKTRGQRRRQKISV